MKLHAITALYALLLACTVSCAKNDSTSDDIDTAAILQAATTRAIQLPNALPNADAWPKGLIHPEPIRLYRDRANLVIVLADGPDKKETGLYVHLPHSSYLPISDSEWKFRPLDNGIYRYERRESGEPSGAANRK